MDNCTTTHDVFLLIARCLKLCHIVSFILLLSVKSYSANDRDRLPLAMHYGKWDREWLQIETFKKFRGLQKIVAQVWTREKHCIRTIAFQIPRDWRRKTTVLEFSLSNDILFIAKHNFNAQCNEIIHFATKENIKEGLQCIP